jgi:DNA mismatch repair protein MutS2
VNHQAFDILEFPALRALVRRNAQTEPARELIDQLEPVEDFARLQNDLKQLAEMIELRTHGIRVSFDGLVDTSESIARLRIEGTTLEPLALLDLARLCARALEARSAILSQREAAPGLSDIVAPLPSDLGKLAGSITKKILPSGELDDRASPQLASIRRDLANARSRITRSLENLMRRASEAIQEELVTVRNDRFVIPVRADHQSRIKGVAHGASSSGATVFIEPLETIEANNELQQLREAEQRAIFEILFALSEQLRHELPALELAAGAITQLDFVNAKAVFAEVFDCVVPAVWSAPAERSGDGALDESRGQAIKSRFKAVSPPDESGSATALQIDTLEFIDARHPLLQHNLRASGGAVVPVSLQLDGDHPVMVISGANAGGKTVVLKTAGLLSLMALSGLPIPATSARVPFYQTILADIGDHQSLAANLSTFTSHVANIANMIGLCTGSAPASSLVLLDEVGTGTDPEEGSALGVAVVDHFKQRGAHVMATTHYSGLKVYAANEPGVLNASVEFDEKTLRPTYRLLVGLAGSSSGLEIARRFGIPDQLIESAATQVTQSSLEAIAYLRRIKDEAEAAEALRRALEEERAATAQKFSALDQEFQKRERERRTEFDASLKRTMADFEKITRELVSKIEDRAARVKVEREAEKRAAELKREAQRAAQVMSETARSQTARHLAKPQGPEGGLPPQLRGVRVVRDGQVVSDARREPVGVQAESQSVEDGARDVRAPRVEERALQVGDRVRLTTLGSSGIIDRIKSDEAELRVGSLHMREKLSNLELISGSVSPVTRAQDAGATSKAGSLEQMRKQATATELHLHSRDSKSEFPSTTELNLIGKTTDDAVDLVDKFLDAAFLNGQRQLRIIHGHGTGALRRAVAGLLADHPHVARYSAAPQDQGGTGATIVELQS